MTEKMEKVMTFKQEEMAQRRSIRAAKNAGTTEQCVATDATSKGYYQWQQMQDMLSAFMQQSQLQNQTMLAIVKKFTKNDWIIDSAN